MAWRDDGETSKGAQAMAWRDGGETHGARSMAWCDDGETSKAAPSMAWRARACGKRRDATTTGASARAMTAGRDVRHDEWLVEIERARAC